MATVLAALVPGIAAMTAVWGFGVVWNVLWLSVFCIAIEAIALHQQPERPECVSSCATTVLWLPPG